MKKTMLAVFAAGLLVATPSCKKGENDPGLSLKSRKARITADWTIDSYESTWTNTQTYVDNASIDGELTKSVTTGTKSYASGAVSTSSISTNSYDGKGPFKKTSSVTERNSSGATTSVKSTLVDEDGTTSNENSGTYTSTVDWKISFVKDGSFTMTKTETSTVEYTTDEDDYTIVEDDVETETETIKGTWSFISKNKADEFKNKERIGLWYQSVSGETKTTETVTYTDKDNSVLPDYTLNNSTTVSTDVTTEELMDSAPSEIWELDMLKSKEMTAMRSYNYATKGTATNSLTDAAGITTSGTSISDNKNEGNTTLKMTRIK